MRELKASSPVTGMFGNITDEAIREAEQDDPPVPELDLPALPGGLPPVPTATKDSLLKRFRIWRR
jgi:hypothetical protein